MEQPGSGLSPQGPGGGSRLTLGFQTSSKLLIWRPSDLGSLVGEAPVPLQLECKEFLGLC